MTSDSLLLVDDQKFNLEVLLEVLGEEFPCRIALDGRTALDLAAREPPDLVLLDLDLPDLSGFEVCQRLKASPATRDTAVVFLTGFNDLESEIRGLSLGAVDFIAKPFNPAMVLARVRGHLSLRRAHREILNHQQLLAQNERLAGMGRMLAVLAHELNTPLGNALLATSALQSLVTGPDAPSLVKLINANLGRAIDLLRRVHLVYLDRPEGVPEVCSLSRLSNLRSTEEGAGLESKGAVVQVDFEENLNHRLVISDYTELVRALLAFSLDLAPRPDRRIGLRGRSLPSGSLELCYSDTAWTGSAQDLERIFEPAFGNPGSATSSGVVPLLIHSLVVDTLKGEIRATPEPGAGITFVVDIPPAATVGEGPRGTLPPSI